MWWFLNISIFYLLGFLLLGTTLPSQAMTHHHNFVVADTPYTRLCRNKSILTVNGQFPGPIIHVTEGDTIVIDQIRYPWSDGPEYITQCPIQPGSMFNQRIVLSDEIGTLWWHAHSDWSRATVHGALIVYPRKKNDYPFPIPHAEIPIILDTFRLTVEFGKRYLIRMVNAVMNNIMFFRIANHNITVVGSDGAYTKQLHSDYITISPGQTIDFLLVANQPPSRYYMAAHVYASAGNFDNTTTTAILQYTGNYTLPSSPMLPTLPDFNDTLASTNFTGRLRSLANKKHPIDVPLNVSTKFFFTLSINLQPCVNSNCSGPFGDRFLASVNNISFTQPRIAILQAYYDRISGVYGDDFPRRPPFRFNYTADIIPRTLWRAGNGTEVRVLRYNSTVEIVFQGTNTVAGIDHPMHLHGQSFYVVGWGFGNFDKDRDPLSYNLVDPPYQNTIAVPRNGSLVDALPFRASHKLGNGDGFLLLGTTLPSQAMTHHHNFVVADTPYSRHGVKQPRYPWSDGPEYITQCPIQPGSMFNQRIVLSDEVGTLWWHAHSDWSRATVHGALIVYPRKKNDYPFPIPHAEIPIILGDPNNSDAFLINGQPGDLYPCSRQDTFKLSVDYDKRYLIRMVNAVMNNNMFFKIANHNITVVGSDGAYTKQFNSDHITISPGQTIDFLLVANQPPSHYYMASHVYASAGIFDNTTTTAILKYTGNYTPPSSPMLPTLPDFNDTIASTNFTRKLRSLANKKHPINVPLNTSTKFFFTLSVNLQPCVNSNCSGPFGDRFLASVNNISFTQPRIAILQAYYDRISGVYGDDFPRRPPFRFNYTADKIPKTLWRAGNGTEVRVLRYNSTVEIVFQGTNTVAGIDHPMHLHGQRVWLMHCHLDRHLSWGMYMVFITRNGRTADAKMMPPPRDFPRC
ncbi:hypothetical protein ACJIZ3_003251 [Penstemon smallii]|uniref:laccase n=1 Tax=Penstemon smallii TaxID=265156 RepID=A0ABD3UBM3_9LAMI